MDLKGLSKPLNISDIDFRVQSINKGGYATILAYKDARVDMNRLDEVCGHMNWKREHTRDNANCIVSLWDEEKKQWVPKEDTGTESNTEKEKGLASDSFKRACFNWGIGRELYDYPVIQVKLNADEFEIRDNKAYATWNLKVREWVWSSEFKDDKMISLSCKDNKGVKRFQSGIEGKPNPNQKTPLEIEFDLAMNDMLSVNTIDELAKVWKAQSKFQANPEFSALKEKRKAELTPKQ